MGKRDEEKKEKDEEELDDRDRFPLERLPSNPVVATINDVSFRWNDWPNR